MTCCFLKLIHFKRPGIRFRDFLFFFLQKGRDPSEGLLENLHFTESRWTTIHHPTFWTWRFKSKLEAWFCWRPICDLCLILWTSWTTTSRRWGEAKTSWLKVRGDSSGCRFFFDLSTFPLEVIDRESSTKRMSALVKMYEEIFLFWNGLFVQDIVEVPKCSLWRLLVWRPILYAPEIEHRYHHLPFF